MNAFPQIARCLLAQWRGYSPDLRQAIEAQWKYLGAPGVIGAAGNTMSNIWWVEHCRDGTIWTTCGDLLMSIKEDLIPASLLVDSTKV